jgi:N-acetylmuramoyl-L-alanine amidase
MGCCRKVSVLILLLILLPSVLYGAEGDNAYQKARDHYRQLLDSGEKQLYRENWEKVIQKFVAVAKGYPTHEKAPNALYMAGKAGSQLYEISRRKGDALEAVHHYELLAEGYPRSSLADDALVLAGGIYEHSLDDGAKAYQAYRAAVDRFPSGDMADRARRQSEGLKQFATVAELPVVVSPAPAVTVKSPAGPRQLTSIRHWASPSYTRIVLELDGAAEFSHGSLPGDPAVGQEARVFVDIRNADLVKGLGNSMDVGEGMLQRIRIGKQPDNALRVVFDLEQLRDAKIFPLQDPHRIVVDIAAAEGTSISASVPELRSLPPGTDDAIASVLGKTPEDLPSKVDIPVVSPAGGLRRIVVDAGHGGKDPGAIGPGGTREKDVTLAIAKILAVQLKEKFGCQVVLTRDKDVYLPLEERTAIANRIGADLFISVHANASHKSEVRGVETYYLNFSKNDQAAAVAARENGTSLKQVSDLEMILFDLMANSKINESSRLAAAIQKKLVGSLTRHYSNINDHGVRQGPFYVLLGATMPSVLVEAAFISNREEEKRLGDRRFQEKTAAAIVQGVHEFAQASRMIATN